MTFEIRIQRRSALSTPEDIRDDAYLQAVAKQVNAHYMAKQVPTTPQVVRTKLEAIYPGVDLTSNTTYALYFDPKTGSTYYCCTGTTSLTIDPANQANPVVVELTVVALVP